MKINTTIKSASCDYRAMDGYTFAGKASWDIEAYRSAFPYSSDYELESRIGRDVDRLYDGFENICETDIGLCSVLVDPCTGAPLCWCSIASETI